MHPKLTTLYKELLKSPEGRRIIEMGEKLEKDGEIVKRAEDIITMGGAATKVVEAWALPGGERHKEAAMWHLKAHMRLMEDPKVVRPSDDSRHCCAFWAYWSARHMLEEMGDVRIFENDPQLESKVLELKKEFAAYSYEMPIYITASAMWADAGFPVIDLTSDFFHAIAVTDFGDCGQDTLKLPFDDFVMRFPENTILGGARSVFVYRTYEVKDASYSDWYIAEDGEKTRSYEAQLSFLRYRATLAKCPLGSLYTDWPEDIQLNDFLASEVKRHRNMNSGAGVVDKNEANAALGVLRRVIVNTMLYINEKGGLPPVGEKRIGADVHVEREHKEHQRFRVGRPIKLGPQIREALTSRSGTTFKVSHKFIVRGHWRNQAYGEKRSLRKKMWIEPHWKGPKDLTDALSREYVVE